MTFLELCQRLRQEVGAAGNGPANVASQSGGYARFVSWIATAWRELQNERRWAFDWAQTAIDLNAMDTEYSLPSDFDVWDAETLRFAGAKINVVPWHEIDKDISGTFGRAAIAPDGVLHLNAPPDNEGGLTFEYWRTPQALTGNTDTPRMPERFHMAIVYRAMLQYALYENAQEVAQQAGRNMVKIETQMVESQLPRINLPPSLA